MHQCMSVIIRKFTPSIYTVYNSVIMHTWSNMISFEECHDDFWYELLGHGLLGWTLVGCDGD